jgi:hypothetical protein
MSVPYGGYLPTWQVMRACIDRLAPDERAAVLGGNAERCFSTQRSDRSSLNRADRVESSTNPHETSDE